MNAKLKVKLVVVFITTITLALLVVACGADKAEEMTPALPAPVAPAEAPQPPEGRPNPGEQGQPPGFGSGGPMGFMTIISEATGLDPETLQEEAAGGATMAEIVTANGGDVEAVKAELIEAMSEMPNADETDVEGRVSDLLNNPLPGPGSEGRPGGFRGDQ